MINNDGKCNTQSQPQSDFPRSVTPMPEPPWYPWFLRASREAAIPPNQLPIALAMDVLFEDIVVNEEKIEEKRGARFS